VIRSAVVFVVVLVLLLIAIGSFGAVGPWELLLALVVALVVAFAVIRGDAGRLSDSDASLRQCSGMSPGPG